MPTPVVLGLDFGGTKIAAAINDCDGNRLGSATVDTPARRGARATLEAGLRSATELIEVAGGHVVSVGVSTIGIPGESGAALAPAVPGWDDLALGAEIGAAFPGAIVRVTNDVKAAATAEATSGALAGVNPGIYLNLGTGLAAAIVVDGTVVSGRHGAAGEIGYNLRAIEDVGRAERVPLEDAVSGKALPDPAGAFERAATDPDMAALVQAFLSELSYHVVNLAIAVDPARVVVGGGMVRSWQYIEGGLRRALDAAVPFPPELMRAAFPYDAPLLGALALGNDAAHQRSTPPRSTPPNPMTNMPGRTVEDEAI
jgi:glucokinase